RPTRSPPCAARRRRTSSASGAPNAPARRTRFRSGASRCRPEVVVVAAEKRSLKVTLVRSTIGHTQATRGTVRALGLRRLHQTVEIADTPQNRGMLRRVAFLLEVEEPASGKRSAAKGDDSK